MTREEVVKAIATAHQAGKGVNLTDANLTGAYLTGVSLYNVNWADDPMTLIDHTVPEAREWAAQRITDADALLHLATDPNSDVRAAVIDNVFCPSSVAAIAALTV